MYRVLIIDDEQRIREGLRERIELCDMGLSVCGEAADAASARRMLTELRPDICLVDIQLEGQNGLDILADVRASLDRTVFVVVTGHSEFSYAQRALRLRVTDYLLKPIDQQRFRAVMETCVETLRGMPVASTAVERDEFSQLCRRFVYGGDLAEPGYQALQEFISWFRLERPSVVYARLFLPTPDPGVILDLKYAVEEELGGRAGCLDEQRGELVIFLACPPERSASAALKSVRELVRHPVPGVALILGSAIGEPAELADEVIVLRREINRRFALGPEFQLVLDDRARRAARRSTPECVFAISRLLATDRWQEALEAMIACVNGLCGDENLASSIPLLYRALRRELADRIAALARRSGVDVRDEWTEFPSIHDLYFVSELIDVLKSKISVLREIERTHGTTDQRDLPTRLARIVTERFRDHLSRAEIAEELAISEGYLSRVVRRAFGMTFTEYVNELRLQRARELILTSRLGIEEIAFQCGFGSHAYFSRVFKKRFGRPPHDLR